MMKLTDVTLPDGTVLSMKTLTTRERFEAFKVIPADDQSNPMRIGWIFSALTVRAINSIPVPQPTSINDIGVLIDKLGDEGIMEAQKFVVESQSRVAEEAKN